MKKRRSLTRKSLLSLVLVWTCVATYAVSAYPGLIRSRCADGSYVDLRLKGDERGKWAVTEDGYTLLRDSLGEWCYATVNPQGETCVSRWRLSAIRSKELTGFLQRTPKRLNIQKKSQALKSNRNRPVEPVSPVIGELKTLVILIQFEDLKFEKSQADFNALFNQINYREDGARGSVKDFYRENSHGKLNLTCDVLGVYTASRSMDYYGGNDRSGQDEYPGQLFLEALDFVSSQINLADYDTDHDGYINNIHVIFAGYGEEAGGPADAIWSHEALFAEPLKVGDVKITGYSCAPELRGNKGDGISRIGVHCHEMGHSFGASDFYDTDYETNGEYSGTGQWDLMASGSWNNEGITPAHFNPYVKTWFGWTDCETLKEGKEEVVLPPSFGSDKIYRIDTGTENDYFLLENRRKIGFDEALPGEGLIIYHVLPQITLRSVDNTINAAFPQTCYPVCAGSDYTVPEIAPISYGDVNSSQCPFPGGSVTKDFTAWTIPAALSSEGDFADVSLKNIRQDDEGNIFFRVTKEKSPDEQAIVFSEGFEEEELGWSDEQLQGDSFWEVYKPSLLAPTMPDAAEGTQYLMMKMEWKFMPLAVARAVTPAIKSGGEGMVFLSFMYQNQSIFSKHGTLKVLYKQAGQINWQCLATLSDINNSWKQFRMDLPAAGTDFQIAFEGEMEAGLLLVDDVKVYSDAATSTSSIPMQPASLVCYGIRGKVCVESDKSARFIIYNLAGQIVYSGILDEGMNTIDMEPGLYIGVCEKAVAKFYVY